MTVKLSPIRYPRYRVKVKYETQTGEFSIAISDPLSLKEASKKVLFFRGMGHKATMEKAE